MRLCILATHPIQYQVPWFRALALQPGVEVQVIFGFLPDATTQGTGFGVPFTWDLDLFGGYSWAALARSGRAAGLDSFFGLSGSGIGAALRAARPDVVLAMGWNSWPLVRGALAARFGGVPLLLRGDSNDLGYRAAWKRTVQAALLRRVPALLAVGAANRAFYRRRGIPPERIFSCPHFVDNWRFAGGADEARSAAARFRERLGVPWEATVALFAGKLQAKKRPGDLLSALGRARNEAGKLWLLVVGDGPLRADLESASRGLPVAFAGFVNQSELPAVYAAADLLVLPSDAGETWGLVVNEAMACGRPAIVSDLVGCREDLVVEGETGWSYRCGDIEALATLLREAAADRPRLVAMGERAHRRVTEGYSVERAVEGTLRACEYVLGGPRR